MNQLKLLMLFTALGSFAISYIGLFVTPPQQTTQKVAIALPPEPIEDLFQPDIKPAGVKNPWERAADPYNLPDTIDPEVWCLAEAIFYEARNQSERGKIVIAQSAVNRAEKKGFPDTVCKVVYQPSRNPKKPKACQYSFTCNPQKAKLYDEPKAWDDAYRIAAKVYYRLDVGYWSKADHYHRDDVNPSWAASMTYLGKIGRHHFYKS